MPWLSTFSNAIRHYSFQSAITHLEKVKFSQNVILCGMTYNYFIFILNNISQNLHISVKFCHQLAFIKQTSYWYNDRLLCYILCETPCIKLFCILVDIFSISIYIPYFHIPYSNKSSILDYPWGICHSIFYILHFKY